MKEPKGLTDDFHGFINSIFVIDSYLKDSAFAAVKRDAKFGSLSAAGHRVLYKFNK